MIVFQHVFVCLKIELVIVDCMLTERNCFVFIDDAADFNCLADEQSDLIFVPQHF